MRYSVSSHQIRALNGGYDYFICYQEVVERNIDAPVLRDDPFGGFSWERRMLPAQCLGRGATSTTIKTTNLIRAASLE